MRMLRLWRVGLAVLPAIAFTFQSAALLNVTPPGMLSNSVTVADFNRDGVADIVSANQRQPGVFTSPQYSIGVQFGVRGAVNTGGFASIAVGGAPLQVVAGDFTSDGNLDIAALMQLDGISPDPMRLCVYPGNGVGGFTGEVCSAIAGQANRIAAGDFNRDGRMDLFVARLGESPVSVLLNNGFGGFTVGPSANIALPVAMAVADWNADGAADVAVISQNGLLTVLLSAASGIGFTAQTYSLPAGASDVLAVDLNRDGQKDLAIAYAGANAITVAFAQGGAGQVLRDPVTRPMPVALQTLAAADLTGDGFAEIVAMSPAGVVVLPVAADGSIGTPNLPGTAPLSTRPLAVGDINGDLRQDVVLAAATGTVALLGQSSATVTKMQLQPGGITIFGQPTVITVQVQLAQPLPPVAPLTGAEVQILDGGRELRRVALTQATGTTADLATVRVELVLPAGERSISARFLGTLTYLGSVSEAIPVTVRMAASTVLMRPSTTDISFTQGLRIPVVVYGPLAPATEGIVKLLVNGSLVSQGLVNAGVSEVFVPPQMPLGKIKLRVTYEGSSYLPSSTDELDFFVKGGTATGGSAASYRGTVAPDSFVTMRVSGLKRTPVSAGLLPWPQSLGGVEVETRDASGGTRVKAGLVYSGGEQINLHLPAGTPIGTRRVVVVVDGVEAATGDLQVASVAPGIFTADGSGSGVPAALAALYRTDGSTLPQSPAAMGVGQEGDMLILSLFGTGLRGARTVTATIDGRSAEILYAGAQPEVPGLDQVNLRVPRELAGRGEVNLVLLADGIAANAVRISARAGF
ncbi:MAG: VCBS repeat-containing protein [Acidobacteria bacterium]|nr:VCBS repeat-containing protein [Acidobacteriota bacterium]